MTGNDNLAKNLITSPGKIRAVSPDAAKAYGKEADKLIEEVNDELEANPKVLELIGGNPFELMRNNHKNHATFMATVLRLNSYDLLAKTIPWVYRVYRTRGFSYDYFPVELLAWKNAVNKCLAKLHSTEINRVYDWMIRNHDGMIQLSVSGKGFNFSPQKETNEMQEILLAFLLQGDTKGSLQLVNQSVKTEDDLKHFYLDVVSPVMYRIGLLWEKNEISVAQEHLSTAIVGRIAAGLYARFANVEVYRGKAVVTAGPNEFHELGARMLADFLEMEGWDVSYLGANTPCREIMNILKQQKPFMVAVSVATLFNLDNAQEAIEAIKADQETRNTKVLVGGLAFNGIPNLWRDFGADGYAEEADKAVLYANKWWDERVA
jgi:MerR family transcriptional regulator, light-induced transcriptional regulator